MFGSNNLYVFHHPSDYASQLNKGKVVSLPSYDSAQDEIAEVSGIKSLFGDGTKSTGINENEKIFPL